MITHLTQWSCPRSCEPCTNYDHFLKILKILSFQSLTSLFSQTILIYIWFFTDHFINNYLHKLVPKFEFFNFRHFCENYIMITVIEIFTNLPKIILGSSWFIIWSTFQESQVQSPAYGHHLYPWEFTNVLGQDSWRPKN